MVYGSGLLMNQAGSADTPGPKKWAAASTDDPTFLLPS